MRFTAHASGSAGNLYEVTEDDHAPLLIEGGVPFKRLQQAVGFRTSQLAGVLVSHSHLDHCAAVPKLLAAGVDCYMSEATAAELGVSGHRVHTLEPAVQVQVGPWTVVPLELVHDVACLGFLIGSPSGERMLYVSDSSYCKYRFANLNLVAVEANYSRGILDRLVEQGTLDEQHAARVVRNHMSLEHAAELVHAAAGPALREVHLLHLSGGNSDEADFKAQIQRVAGVPVHVAPERRIAA